MWACASVEPRLNMKSSQQKNNQTKQYKKKTKTETGCCFHFPGESPEIPRTFSTQQPQKDRHEDKKTRAKINLEATPEEMIN